MATPDSLDKYAESIGIELNQTEVDKVNARLEDMSKTFDLYFGSGGSLVQVWKVYGCIAVRCLLLLSDVKDQVSELIFFLPWYTIMYTLLLFY